MKLKIQLLLYPYLRLSILFISCYTFIDWYFFIRHPSFTIKEEVVQGWLPFVLVWIPLLIFLRPQIKLLDLKRPKGNLPFLYHFVPGIFMAFTTILMQQYIALAAGKLTVLEKITDLPLTPASKFYQLKNYVIDKAGAKVHYATYVSGKYNRYLNLSIHIACPIGYTVKNIDGATDVYAKDSAAGYPVSSVYDSVPGSADSMVVLGYQTVPAPLNIIQNPPVAWLGLVYEKQISNSLPQSATDKYEDEFYDNTMKKFYRLQTDSFIYLERLGNSEERNYYFKTIHYQGRNDAADAPVVLRPKYKTFISRTAEKSAWVMSVFLAGVLIWFIMIISVKFKNVSPQYGNF